ncbi:branched-chain amino acid ABC transporter permease [Enhydrobacter sp.]|jgi:branched-chain amino acid transport system permease protein|uniref:branched-chain amino acid ABC transporter permease n=1 Tax=Enhydrobacter sp. TaxID=1894999 RepID=UPI002629D2BC|nr:branched-chain amino acid ABC transporter permease [Enhydrobacter sp.]WIM14254.1 MAG: ABC transporter, permease protein 2 (cluster 4, leucine/isoleucine/valine/benzoate) [Enhydrobacter sp.]
MAAATSLARRVRWRWLEIAFWLLAFGAIFLPAGRHLILNQIAILALFALSLDLILGYAGIVSLGHAAFFGLGAYVAGLAAKAMTGAPLAGLGLAMLAAAVLGFATSFLVLRGSDLTRLMVTLGVASVLHELANALRDLTGGADGLQGVVMGPVLGLFPFDLYGRTAYAYSVTILFALMLVARAVVHSPFGLSLMAIRRNRLRASALGVPVNRRLVAAYTLAAAFAGAAGALLAQTTAFVSLEFFDFNRSADVLLVLIIGGAGWLYGGIVGAILFQGLQDGLSALTPEYWQFWIGLFLVAFVMIGRERMMVGVRGLWMQARR